MNQRTNQPRLSVVTGDPTPALNAGQGATRDMQLTHRQVVIDGTTFWLVPVQGAGAEQVLPHSTLPAWPGATVRDEERARPHLSLLTAREIQIAALVAQGFVNKQIAAELSISEWTVSTHLRRVFAKLKVDTRAAMVAKCFGPR
jgi:DNA-binding CsgD family transcriptional regulator